MLKAPRYQPKQHRYNSGKALLKLAALHCPPVKGVYKLLRLLIFPNCMVGQTTI